ncbi:hypothetical protein OEZ71_13480 [Defluviimonas sp. WL0050]|uniref:Helix-turn-helix domain-containing protein n=1 Tax=Albidovulum litorale TaxID=2984134 RepID=A0ABT2ZQ70_9RHOB|nr:hypothetical protein [Defluviimonas sp. WL0050]MCV2873305.1 hypothetical protein [Defluviimonas sp. WL0050]
MGDQLTLLDGTQTRELLGGVSEDTLARLLKNPPAGFPTPRHIGRRRFFLRSEVEHFILEGSKRPGARS